jgi:serine/threonine protein kinase
MHVTCEGVEAAQAFRLFSDLLYTLSFTVLIFMVSDGEGMTVNGKPHQAAYVQTISKQILLGLDFLHTLGIVHCGMSAILA